MNNRNRILLLILCLLSTTLLKSQIDSVIVEKYYISDTNDATDITGGGLPQGSVTYRVYVDLAPGSKLLELYGTELHPFRITSTADFFNNHDRGKSTGREIRGNRLNENTLALDTWITFDLASDIHSGILKAEDTNGSIVGGINNDGGSEAIPGGLIVNNDPAAGIPLTVADGLMPLTNTSLNWLFQYNGVNITSTTDTSIFGSLKTGRSFISSNFLFSNGGSAGSGNFNRVLIAQLTTTGELRFSINIKIEEINGSGTRIVRYVAENPTGEERTSRFLTYPAPPPPPPVCGCKDNEYLEYSKTYDCHVQDSCKTRIVYGCMDPRACNYDPQSNFNIQSLCCYPGRCNNRDIKTVCPDIHSSQLSFNAYPNPAADRLTLDITNGKSEEIRLEIIDSGGTSLHSEFFGKGTINITHSIDLSCLTRGYYFIRLVTDELSVTKPIIKN